MLVSPSTYSYMFKTNSNFEDFIESKLKGISPSNQVLIARFMFENIKQNENSTHSKSSQDIVSNTMQSLSKTFSDLLIILPIENTKTGINKLMSNIVFHLTEIHHYLNFQSAILNQRRDEFYHKNFWVNIEDISDYFSMKVAQAGQNLQNVKTYLVNRKNSHDNRSNLSR